MANNFKYELKKTTQKSICPNCGRKTFKPYVDAITKKEAGSKYGRCDRVNSCQYILYPKTEYDKDWTPPPPQPYVAPKPTEYIEQAIVLSTFFDFKTNVFYNYLVELFSDDIALSLMKKYNIGTAKQGGTIFWQQDLKGRFRTAKVMYYKPNGRRDKDKHSWFVHKKIRSDFNFQQCLFGLHLVDGTKPVALCESEKTAVLMSVYQPEYTWIASGGSEMLNAQRLGELPRLDKVFPDNGFFEKWEMKTSHFDGRQMDITVDKAVSNGLLEEGSDILDLILKKL